MGGFLGIMTGGNVKTFEFSISIDADVTNYNLSTALIALGWNETDRLNGTLTNNAYIGSTTTGAALTIPSTFPAYSNISIVNNGVIAGRGGNGGNGGTSGAVNGTNGAIGGLALSVAFPTYIDNRNGIIGGGGGGGGGADYYNDGVDTENGASGGGGRGYTPGSAGTAGSGAGVGQAGTKTAAGTGGGAPFFGQDGGGGGNLGADGANGGGSGGLGGTAGDAISGYSYITWVNTGSILGATSG